MQDNRDKFNRILGMFCSNGQTGADLLARWSGISPSAARNANHRAAGHSPASRFQVCL